MKPGIDLISVFKKQKDETGQEYFVGTIDPSNFKKNKEEIQIILMHGKLLPSSLVGRHGGTQENLYMFSQENNLQG
jgi:hypothetical protein